MLIDWYTWCLGISLQKLVEPSLKAFAEEVYYKSKEFGIYDIRTSIAFYNLSHVFHHLVCTQFPCGAIIAKVGTP